jgi:hypothetical protein
LIIGTGERLNDLVGKFENLYNNAKAEEKVVEKLALIALMWL